MPLSQQLQILEAGRCAGWFDEIVRVPSDEEIISIGSWRVRGWVWDVKYKSVIKKVVIVDDQGVVVGYALTRDPRPDVITGDSRVTNLYSGWAGHAISRHATKLFAYALLDDDHSACILEGSHIIGSR